MKYWIIGVICLLANACDFSQADSNIAVQVCNRANQEARNNPAKECRVDKSGDYENGYKYSVTFLNN